MLLLMTANIFIGKRNKTITRNTLVRLDIFYVIYVLNLQLLFKFALDFVWLRIFNNKKCMSEKVIKSFDVY